jgi:hypothetical protein
LAHEKNRGQGHFPGRSGSMATSCAPCVLLPVNCACNGYGYNEPLRQYRSSRNYQWNQLLTLLGRLQADEVSLEGLAV